MEKLNDYQKAAYEFCSGKGKETPLLAGALGMCGEAGECAEIVKKALFQGHEVNKDKMIEELGDVMWYIALTATGLGVTLEEIATYNIEKLSRRYPTGHFRKTDSTERKE